MEVRLGVNIEHTKVSQVMGGNEAERLNPVDGLLLFSCKQWLHSTAKWRERERVIPSIIFQLVTTLFVSRLARNHFLSSRY
jgi:hypothetical protein